MIRAARERPDGALRRLLEGRTRRRRRRPAGARRGIGPGDAARPAARAPPRCRSTSAARSSELLGGLELDIVHVHDPFAPSAASVALRHSRSLNVGSFHEPTERILSTQVARPLVEIFFGRLDARTASSPDDVGPDGALLPGHLRAGRRRGRIGRWRAGGREPAVRHGHRGRCRAPVRIAFCLRGGARRAAALPAGAAAPAPRARLGGGGLAAGRGRGPRSRAGCASGSTSSARARRRPRS